jgi:hypothetical protein
MRVKDPAPALPPQDLPAPDLPKPGTPDRVAYYTVIGFACFVALLVLTSAFFIDRNGDIDELMMYNPAYMLAHFGKITFPSYAYRAFYDKPVVIHPPIHLGWIGLLERAGFTWYYAEAMPAVLLWMLGIVLVVFSAFPAPVKIGLLFSLGFVVSTGDAFCATFGVRPEGEVHAAWFAGLVLLESGRLANWNRVRLFAGAFLLTYASGVHYYACAALAGVVVYVIWAAFDLGWAKAEPVVAALIAGGCLFGIPYVALYLRPYLKEILTYVQMTTRDGGILASMRIHFSLYQNWAYSSYYPRLIREPARLGLPLMVFSSVLLGAIKPTRGIAIASLPLQIFVFLFAAHKLSNYLIHEVALFAAAIAIVALACGDWAWRGITSPKIGRLFLPGAAAGLCFYLLFDHGLLNAASSSPLTHVHEGEFARAAARQILGPHATVTGRDGGWYTSGAAYWWDLEREMLQSSHYDAASFFSNFDAAVDYTHQSETTGGTSTISAAYAEGVLKLHGFYFGATNEQLQLQLFSARPVTQVVGYASSGRNTYRFDERPGGDYQVFSAACPMIPQLERSQWIDRWPGTFSAVTYLPHALPGGRMAIATVLAPRKLAQPASWMSAACSPIARIEGSLTPVDRSKLLQGLRREDAPIGFPRMLDELPGYRGVVLPADMLPPKDGSPIAGIVALQEIRATAIGAKVDRLAPIRLTTAPEAGAFSATIPVHPDPRATASCWLVIRLKVIRGEIGFSAFGPGGTVAQTLLPIIKSDQPQDVALRIPRLTEVNQIVIFNVSHLSGAQVDLLDATVLITPDSPAAISRAK